MMLTDKEIDEIYIAAPDDQDGNDFVPFARAIESALLAKLAGMELPEPEDRFVFAGLDWHRATPEYFKQSQGRTNCIAAYSAAQLHQAFAQGAASQLSAEPSGFISPHDLKMLKEGYPATVVMLPGAKRTQPLYTLKEPK